MAEVLYELLKIERDQGFVLDDQNIGRDLRGEFAAGVLDKMLQRLPIDAEYVRGVLLGKGFDGNKEEGLAGFRANLTQMPFRRRRIGGWVRCFVDGDRIPDGGEETKQLDARGLAGVEDARLFDQRLQGGRDI